MRYIFVLAFLFSADVTLAHQPLVVSPETVNDVVVIERPEVSFAYYGELDGFPHTYEIRTEEPFTLYTHILEPDIGNAANDHAGIIVRERDDGRGVEEIARLRPSDGTWESFFEYAGGDRYLSGPEYEAQVGPGVYRIEVSTPDNAGKYALVVGRDEDFSGVGYFELIERIYDVKRFFGKPGIAVVQSPFVYGPLAVLIVLGLTGWRVYRKKYG